jgi:hypothetical protein
VITFSLKDNVRDRSAQVNGTMMSECDRHVGWSCRSSDDSNWVSEKRPPGMQSSQGFCIDILKGGRRWIVVVEQADWWRLFVEILKGFELSRSSTMRR